MVEHFNTRGSFWQETPWCFDSALKAWYNKSQLRSNSKEGNVRGERLFSIIIIGNPLIICSGVFAVGRTAT
jgi:hypothetical protein